MAAPGDFITVHDDFGQKHIIRPGEVGIAMVQGKLVEVRFSTLGQVEAREVDPKEYQRRKDAAAIAVVMNW